MPSTVSLKAVGLNYQPNALDLPEGSLTIASNVILRRDNVIESRRGYKLSGESFGSPSDRATQLMVYKDRVLRHYASSLQFQDGVNNDGTDNYTTFSGAFYPVEDGLRMKSISANGNMYFTTSDGIKKISAKSASQLSSGSGYIVDAGGIKAIEAEASLVTVPGDQTSFFSQDSAVAYRIVWGLKDANDNLILGAPSQRVVIYNPLLDLLLQDTNRTLGALGDTCATTSTQLLQDGNYLDTLKVTSSDTATTLRTNLIALAAKLDNDFLYADDLGTGGILNIDTASTSVISDVLTVTFSSGTATDYFEIGSKVYLDGFDTALDTPTTSILNGAREVATVNASSITFNITGSGSTSIVFATPLINSNEYRSIEEPVEALTPATNDMLVSLQTYLEAIMTRLSLEPSTGSLPSINNTARAEYIDILDVTRSSQVKLNISVPDGITTNHFVQVYRSNVTSAEGTAVLATDIIPNDELKLAYEAFPTSAEISAKSMTITDIVTDTFLGANLYTNAATGEGILQANDVPPLSKDINTFKGYTFYANTQTRQRLELSLLGITNMIADYNNSITPKLLVSDGTTDTTYSFINGAAEITELITVADVSGSLNDKYFDAYSGEDERKYRFFYNVVGSTSSVSTVGIDEMAKILLDENDSAVQVAIKTTSVINRYPLDFFATVTGSTFTVACVKDGYTSDVVDSGSTGFAVVNTTQGRGESVSNKEILLSSSASVGQAVDETARSLVKVINQTSGGTIYAYYLSGNGDVPGSILLEGRSLGSDQFYLLANNSNTGSSFNPDIGPTKTITSISLANPTVVTSASHGLANQDSILILNSDSTPGIDGVKQITYINANSFSVDENVTIAGTTGVFIPLSEAVTSENEAKVGRLYYSKYQQTEAVPATNYIDVGANDRAILRIFPLRDSLFVFKEDGLYRVSGEVAPFSQALFDATCKLTAPDTVDVNNNLIYGLSTQGVSVVSESGVNIVTRPIDTEILKLSTYDNFRTLSWGIGYESDNSYTLYTVTGDGKDVADIAYRYSSTTNSWTTFDKTATCGVIHTNRDIMYLGAGDTNYIEMERKNFDRYDYADREADYDLTTGNYNGTVLQLSSVSDLKKGDVVTQTQYLTSYEFNMLLKKLDSDPGVGDNNYYTTLNIGGGENLRTKLESLATKLDADSGIVANNFASSIASSIGTITANTADASSVITTSSAHGLITGRIVIISGSNSTPSINGTYTVTVLSPTTFSIPLTVTSPGTSGSFIADTNDFLDIKTCYNKIIDILNVDTGASFGNYSQNDTTAVKEAIIANVNYITKRVTLNIELDFLLGPLKIYHAIKTIVRYSPVTMGDALSLKHIRESTIIFQNKAFTSATLSFASDLLPEFVDVEFNGDGNGIFGHSNFGGGFFGGASNSAPMRTYIPRDKQRCRFLVIEFEHSTAREQYAIYGISLTGEVTSVRGYR